MHNQRLKSVIKGILLLYDFSGFAGSQTKVTELMQEQKFVWPFQKNNNQLFYAEWLAVVKS